MNSFASSAFFSLSCSPSPPQLRARPCGVHLPALQCAILQPRLLQAPQPALHRVILQVSTSTRSCALTGACGCCTTYGPRACCSHYHSMHPAAAITNNSTQPEPIYTKVLSTPRSQQGHNPELAVLRHTQHIPVVNDMPPPLNPQPLLCMTHSLLIQPCRCGSPSRNPPAAQGSSRAAAAQHARRPRGAPAHAQHLPAPAPAAAAPR